MPIESLPTFTKPARKLWEIIPADMQKILLSNCWCGKCRQDSTISNFSGAVRGGDLLLVGKCAVCHGDVARAIEFEDRDDGTYVLLGPASITEQELMQELQILGDEQKAVKRKANALYKKSREGTITRKEEAELKRLTGVDLVAFTSKWLSISGRKRR